MDYQDQNQCVMEASGMYRVSGLFSADDLMGIASGIAVQALNQRKDLKLAVMAGEPQG
jgi:hypothetical protein